MSVELSDALHDEIDAQEEIRDEAAGIVQDVKGKIRDLASSVEPDELFASIAEAVEERLIDLTTVAARRGYDAAKSRAKRFG